MTEAATADRRPRLMRDLASQHDRPAPVDVLADILAATRLGAAVAAQAELVPPWGIQIDPAAEAAIHFVQRGSCWLRTHHQRQPLHLGSAAAVPTAEAGVRRPMFIASSIR